MSASGSGVKIAVRVYPGAATNEVVGTIGGVLQVRVSAPPVKGRANEELVAFLSEALGVSRDSISIVRGHVTRNKVVAIEGLSQAEVMRRLLPSR